MLVRRLIICIRLSWAIAKCNPDNKCSFYSFKSSQESVDSLWYLCSLQQLRHPGWLNAMLCYLNIRPSSWLRLRDSWRLANRPIWDSSWKWLTLCGLKKCMGTQSIFLLHIPMTEKCNHLNQNFIRWVKYKI